MLKPDRIIIIIIVSKQIERQFYISCLIIKFYRGAKNLHCFSVVDCSAITCHKDILNLKESIVLMSYLKDIIRIKER